MNSLVEFWGKCDLKKPPFIHPYDDDKVESEREFADRLILNHQTFIRSTRFGKPKDKDFHLSLLPVPYIGNLDKADIVILLLNPGFGLSDYHTQDDAEHSRLLVKMIQQDFKGNDYPFLSLNPEMAWSGGFMWWEKKLSKVLRTVADKYFEGSYLESLKLLSQRIAAIELVPYHSKVFGARRLIRKMPSALAAQAYIRDVLVPKARDGNATLIAARQVATLELPPGVRNIVQYEPALARGAHLGPSTPGGEAILRAIEERPPR
jgi:hypothetical protein